MLRDSDDYTEAVKLSKLLQEQYENVRTEVQAVVANTVREEVHRIAAANEQELQRLIGEAIAKHRGGGLIPRPQIKQVAVAVAIVLFVWLGASFLRKGIAIWQSGTPVPVERRDGRDGEDGPGLDESLAEIARGPLHLVATERYDSLFAQRDPAFQQLIERVGIQAAATLDSTAAQSLARWTADSATDDDREVVHAAAFQAALRELTGGEYQSPVNGSVDRARCDQDEYCKKLVERWRGDRTTGMRLLPPIPDNRSPRADELKVVEKVVIYSRLAQ